MQTNTQEHVYISVGHTSVNERYIHTKKERMIENEIKSYQLIAWLENNNLSMAKTIGTTTASTTPRACNSNPAKSTNRAGIIQGFQLILIPKLEY